MTGTGTGSGSGSGLLRCLRHRDYRLLMAAFTTSEIGGWAYGVALVVWVYDRTGSLGWVTAVGACRFVPGLLLSAYAGVVADRLDKVALMRRTDVALTGLMTLMGVLVALDAPVVVVLALVALTSAGCTVYAPGTAGLTPLAVPERDLGSANALRNSIDNLVVIAGPGVGAVFLALGPPELTFWLNAASFAASAVLLGRVHTRSTRVDVTDEGRAGPLAQTLVGVRAIASSSSVAVMVGFCLLATLVYGLDTVLFVSVSDDLLGTGPDGYGYLLAGLGVGGLLAAPVVTRAEARPSVGPVIVAGMAAYCLPTLLLLVTHRPEVAFAAQIVRGAGTLFVDVLAITALQRTLPAELLARVFGAFNALCIGAVLLGSVSASVIIGVGGVTAGVWVSGAVTFGLSLLGLPALRRIDRLARERRAELQPRIALLEACDLFAGVPDGGLAQLAAAAGSMAAPAGAVVVAEGEPADALYVVEAGSLQVTATMPLTAPDLVAGDHFGEIGLIEGIARTATVTALTDVRLLRVPGKTFLDALTTGQPSAAILDGAAVRLGRTHPTRALRRAGLTTTEGGTA